MVGLTVSLCIAALLSDGLLAPSALTEESKCYMITSSPGREVKQRIDCETGKPINETLLRGVGSVRRSDLASASPNRRLSKASDVSPCTVENKPAFCLKAGR